MADVLQARKTPSMVLPDSGTSQYIATSLYVGDLDPDVSEAELYEVFSQIGQVISIRVCRDLMTKKSLGYAYVNYGTHRDASQALELLNFTLMRGKPIRIMYSHRDPSIRKSGAGNIFIKNLDKSIDNKTLHDTFAIFGSILSCRVVMDGDGISKGYGFVQFEKEEFAQMAIEKVNGMLINDKQVSVQPFIRKQERDVANSGKFTNVYVKNLAELTSDEDLQIIFSAFGPISSASVMRNADGKSKCFGFVNFENADDATTAVDKLNGKVFHEREWYVGRAQKKSEREAELKAKFEQEKSQGTNLYLKNIDDNIDEERLSELFSMFGTVTSCKITKSLQGQSMGSGFVTFSSYEDAIKAVTDMNGKMVGSKPLYVALAQRKEERRVRLQEQFAQMQNAASSAPPMAGNLPPTYLPGVQEIGPQMFYGQPTPSLLLSQPNSFGYQQHMVSTGVGSASSSIPSFVIPPQRPSQPIQRPVNRRVGPIQPQHHQPPLQFPRVGNRSMRYSPFPQSVHDAQMQGAVTLGAANTSSNITLLPALASALASAPLSEQCMMLGEHLYPLVDQLEHEHAGKVTGMLLELDQTEVLHLIESPEALKVKVAEAMSVLRMAQGNPIPLDHFAGLSLGE